MYLYSDLVGTIAVPDRAVFVLEGVKIEGNAEGNSDFVCAKQIKINVYT